MSLFVDEINFRIQWPYRSQGSRDFAWGPHTSAAHLIWWVSKNTLRIALKSLGFSHPLAGVSLQQDPWSPSNCKKSGGRRTSDSGPRALACGERVTRNWAKI